MNIQRFSLTALSLSVAILLSACSVTSSQAKPKTDDEIALTAASAEVTKEAAAVEGLFAKDINVCMESLYTEYTVTDLRREGTFPVTAGNGWCGPDHNTGYGLLFRVQAQQGHVIDFNLFNPDIGEPFVNARDKTAPGNVKVWEKQFSVGQKETFQVAGRTFEIERLPDTARKEFRITLTS